ncbi:oligosaccharide flippase family protein [Massilia sp. H-1]|nr:oligosaccharide flippase family protein [Massilia sp. H-1]
MSADLRSKTVRAIGHLGLGGALGKIVSLGTTLIMARLLSPADYGLMAMAMVVIGFVGFFNEVGIGSAIVQKPKLTTTEVNGCFAIALIASAVLSLITFLLSGVMARFFGNPQLEAMIAALSLAFILGAFGTVPLAFLRKELHFKAISLSITILAILVQSAVALVLAWRGFGVWSLVWGSLVSSALQSVGAFWLSPWRPRGAYDLREAASTLVMYGLKVTSSRVFWYLYTNADKVIIGKVLGERAGHLRYGVFAGHAAEQPDHHAGHQRRLAAVLQTAGRPAQTARLHPAFHARDRLRHLPGPDRDAGLLAGTGQCHVGRQMGRPADPVRGAVPDGTDQVGRSPAVAGPDRHRQRGPAVGLHAHVRHRDDGVGAGGRPFRRLARRVAGLAAGLSGTVGQAAVRRVPHHRPDHVGILPLAAAGAGGGRRDGAGGAGGAHLDADAGRAHGGHPGRRNRGQQGPATCFGSSTWTGAA